MTTTGTTPTSSAASPPVQPVLLPEQVAHLPEDRRTASGEKLLVLQRIAAQRARLHAAKQARLQAKALKSQPQVMPPPDAPLPERAKAFVRLHPVATAAAAGALLLVGPRRMIRLARWVSPVLPVLVNWRK